MSDSLLPRVIEEPGPPPVASVIWLHGLGANGYDFLPVCSEVAPKSIPTRFIFPHAPEIPVTLNGGAVMPAWHDADRRGGGFKIDRPSLETSRKQVAALIAAEIESGIDASRIVLAGFSQGGGLALATGLQFPKSLAGIMALSTYLPHPEEMKKEDRKANQATPVLIHHGSSDPVVLPAYAEKTKAQLTAWQHPFTCKSYPMAHSVCPQQILDIKAWLAERLQPASPSGTQTKTAP